VVLAEKRGGACTEQACDALQPARTDTICAPHLFLNLLESNSQPLQRVDCGIPRSLRRLLMRAPTSAWVTPVAPRSRDISFSSRAMRSLALQEEEVHA